METIAPWSAELGKKQRSDGGGSKEGGDLRGAGWGPKARINPKGRQTKDRYVSRDRWRGGLESPLGSVEGVYHVTVPGGLEPLTERPQRG